MEKNLNRNDLCYCGSGKKFKNCHMGKPKAKSANRSFMIIGAMVLIVAIASISLYFNLRESPKTNKSFSQPNVNAPTPQPAGEAPPGKVWSSEHGHWHDL